MSRPQMVEISIKRELLRALNQLDITQLEAITLYRVRNEQKRLTVR